MKKRITYCLNVCVMVFALCSYSQGQDLSHLKGQKPFTFHGNMGGGANFYTSNEPYPTRDPFSWNLYGSFIPAFYGYSLPFSFVITQYSKSYTTPFSMVGISPSYKWIKLHLGYRNISFSPLVFDGTSFLGAGIELTPKDFYFGAFYGRLNKAISEDTTFGHTLQPQYARTGYGVKVGVGSSNENISIQYFHAKDDTGSIQRVHDSLTTLLPQENSVLGSSWHFMFFKKLTFTGDAAVSLLNRDLSYDNIDSIGYVKVPSIVRIFAPLNYSSVLSWSGQTLLSLVLNNFNASLGYRRVQPDFKSLGVPYALDDIEMINGNAGTSLLKGKISLMAAFTTQHNDLAHMLSSMLVTRTGNFSLNTFVSQHLNLALNLTGVRVLQKDGLLKINDSVRMNQLMFTGSLAPSFNFSNTTDQQTITGNFTYTDLMDHNPVTQAQTAGNNLSASLNYSLFFSQKYYGVNSGVVYSVYGQQNNQYISLGLNVGANAQLLKDHSLSLQGSIGYFLNHSTGSPVGNNITFSFSSSYSLHQHHSFGLYASYVITPPVNLNPLNVVNHVPYAVNSKNLSGGVTYSYSF